MNTSVVENVPLYLNARGRPGTKREGGETVAITLALTPRIPPKLYSLVYLVDSSIGIGDPKECILVAPPIIILSLPEVGEGFEDRVDEVGMRVKNEVKRRWSGYDHTSTNAPDPIRTPQLSVSG
ncbi:hypothetical protein Ancab_025141 [Ancistrocladus abbreviatus]